ncbi:hypothetical protein ACWIGW_44205 [Nocardia brasiliensis]
MIHIHRCITLACDECDTDFSDDDFVAHFDDLAAAGKAAEALGWLVTGARILCAGCTAKEACALTGGHIFGEPTVIECKQYRGTVRRCEHCGTGDYDPPLAPSAPETGRGTS